MVAVVGLVFTLILGKEALSLPVDVQTTDRIVVSVGALVSVLEVGILPPTASMGRMPFSVS